MSSGPGISDLFSATMWPNCGTDVSRYQGKTAPRLLEDLLHYDPRFEALHGSNILTDFPPPFDESVQRRPTVPKGSCRHVYMVKYPQSRIPPIDVQPDNASIYTVASFCQECRCHLVLTVEFRGNDTYRDYCPSQQYPLHHFLHDPSTLPSDADAGERCLQFGFRCSAEPCRARAFVQLRPPRIRPEHLRLLTEPKLLEARREAAVQVDRQRDTEFVTAKPIDALEVLYRYLQDSFERSRPANKRRIPPLNKRFMVTFGTDCNDLLSGLGFKYMQSVSRSPPS